jgi:hypothetical protein
LVPECNKAVGPIAVVDRRSQDRPGDSPNTG